MVQAKESPLLNMRASFIGPLIRMNRGYPHNSTPFNKDIWFNILSFLLSARDLNNVARVSKYIEVMVNEYDLQKHCNEVNLRTSRFTSLTKENTLTVETLTAGWLLGDRLLRQLVKCPVGNFSKDIYHLWTIELMSEFFNSARNGFLNNGYLRVLLITALIRQSASLLSKLLISSRVKKSLFGDSPKTLDDIVEPSSIFLYGYLAHHYPIIDLQDTEVEYKQAIISLRHQVVSSVVGYEQCEDFLNSVYYDRNFCIALYQDLTVTIQFLVRAKMAGFQFHEVAFFPSLSLALRRWLGSESLSTDQFKLFLDYINEIHQTLIHQEQDTLSRCLSVLHQHTDRVSYLEALRRICKIKKSCNVAMSISTATLKALMTETSIYTLKYEDFQTGYELLAILLNFALSPESAKRIYRCFTSKVRINSKLAVEKSERLKFNECFQLILTLSPEMLNFIIDDTADATHWAVWHYLLSADLDQLNSFLQLLQKVNLPLLELMKQSLITLEDLLLRMKIAQVEELGRVVSFCRGFVFTRELVVHLINFASDRNVAEYQEFFAKVGRRESVSDELLFMLSLDSAICLKSGICVHLIRAIGLQGFNFWTVVEEGRELVVDTLSQLEKSNPEGANKLVDLIQRTIHQGRSTSQRVSLGLNTLSLINQNTLSFFQSARNKRRWQDGDQAAHSQSANDDDQNSETYAAGFNGK